MNQELLNKIESDQLRKDPLTFNVGDTVKVHTKVVEGEKERIQVSQALLLAVEVMVLMRLSQFVELVMAKELSVFFLLTPLVLKK